MSLKHFIPPCAVLVAVSIAPSAARAATDFTGVTADAQVVTFTSQSGGYLTGIGASKGLTAGAKVVGLDKGPDGRLFALDTTGRVSTLDAASKTFTPLFGGAPVIAAGVSAAGATTFSVAVDGVSALVVTDTQALRIDLASGAVAPTTSPTGTTNVALDQEADGRFVGLDAGGEGLFEATPGSAFSTLAKSKVPSGGRTAVSVGPDGTGWAIRGIDFRQHTDRQSFLQRIDTARGLTPTGIFFQRPLTAIAATGTSPDVRRAPKAKITIAARQSLRDIRRHGGLQVTYTSDQPGQRIATAHRGKLNTGFNADLGELAAPSRRTLTLRASKTQLHRITIRSHIRVHVAIHGIARATSATIMTADKVVTITR